ncbi:MAG: DUF503 domain-containing protein [Chitinophagales bacterium]
MYGAIGEIRLFIPTASSLKDRRRIIKSLRDRLRQQCNVSIADLSEDRLWQSAVLAFAIVSSNMSGLESELHEVEAQLYRYPEDVEVLSFEYRYLE